MESEVKLPKSWKHWCRKAKLKPHPRGQDTRQKDAWFYLRGHGRMWRVNCFEMLECGDTYEEFDRWALYHITKVRLPKTELEMLAAVEVLVSEHNGDRDVGCSLESS